MAWHNLRLLRMLLCCCSLNKPNKYTAEELALMKSQDIKYLTMKERVEAEVGDMSAGIELLFRNTTVHRITGRVAGTKTATGFGEDCTGL